MKIAVFVDRIGAHINHIETDWDGACARFENPPVVKDKAEAVLFSLCEFGDKVTERGSLRSNDNVLRVYGACGDYDGETLQPDTAVEALRSAGVRALVYTSPSHRAEAPRWRVVLPFDTPGGVDDHAAAVEKLNGIVGGGLSSESFTLSQPFYIGQVEGHEFRSWKIEGRDIRGLDVPRVPWRGGERAGGGYLVDTATLVDELEAGQEVHPAIRSLAMRGFSREELEDIVNRSKARWDRPERAKVALDSDIPRAVESASRKREEAIQRKLAALAIPPRPQPPAPRSSLFVRGSDLTKQPRPLKWLIRDRIEHPTFVSLFGPPEHGKTFVSIDMACCVATGRPWRGNATRKGRVYYFAGEGHNGLGRRLLAWKIANGVSDEEWAAAEFHSTPKAVNMNSPDAMQEVYEEFKVLGDPDFVVIDTLTRHTPGVDQSAQKDMTPFVFMCDQIVRRYETTVMLIQHTGQGNNERAMGSIVVKGAVDVEMRALKVNGAVELSNTKSKESQRFPDQYFKFQDVELPWLENPDAGPEEMPRRQHSAVLVECDAAVDTEKGGRPNQAITVLREVLQAGPLSETICRDNFKRLYKGTNDRAKGRAFKRALEGALSAGLVVYDPDSATYRLAFG